MSTIQYLSIYAMIRIQRWRKKIAYQWIFENQLRLCISVLRLFGDTKKVSSEQLSLKDCEEGSIGKGLYKFLKSNGLHLVPWYEAHDLKHVILGYGVTPPEEMKMQAFMFGNSGFSWVITPIYCSFVIWTPSVWRELLYHFKMGLYTKNIGYDTIDSVKNLTLEAYKRLIGLKEAKLLASLDQRSLFNVVIDEIFKRFSKPVIPKLLSSNDTT